MTWYKAHSHDTYTKDKEDYKLFDFLNIFLISSLSLMSLMVIVVLVLWEELTSHGVNCYFTEKKIGYISNCNNNGNDELWFILR